MTRTNNFNIWPGHWTPSPGSYLIYQRATGRDCGAIVLATPALVIHAGSRGRCPFYRVIQLEKLDTEAEAERPGRIIVTAQLTSPRLLSMNPGVYLAARHVQPLRWNQSYWGRGYFTANRPSNATEQERNYRLPAASQFTPLYVSAWMLTYNKIMHAVGRNYFVRLSQLSAQTADDEETQLTDAFWSLYFTPSGSALYQCW